jgi:putative peptidoglycan lipid II flippase
MSEAKHITKAASVIGIATLASRILGFIRDCIIARLFGTAQSAQAFVIAFTIPNMLRDLVGEGAANAAFVPVLSEYKTKHTKEEFWQLANMILNIILVVLAAITIFGVIFAGAIVRIMAPGFVSQPEKLRETIILARIMFPYVLLIGLAAYGTGVLNSLKHFSVPAMGPCLMNIAMIAIPLIFSPRMRDSVLALAFAVLVGGVMQLSIQVPVLYKKGMSYRFCLDPAHPAARQIGRLLVPRALASSVYQLNIVVNRMCSSLTYIVGEGAPAALYYANRLFQFPLAIFGIALAQAALPTLSEQAHEDSLERFKETFSFALKLIFFISIPAAVGLGLLRIPITEVLFQHGRFDVYSTQITATAVLFYSFGLIFYAGNNVLTSSFYSLKDTMTPVKVAVSALMLNIVLNLLLMRPFKVAGLALSTALSGALSFILLLILLSKKIGCLHGRAILADSLRSLAAAGVMGVAIFILRNRIYCNLAPGSTLTKTLCLLVFLPLGVMVYLASAFLFGADEIKPCLKWISRRR